MITAVQAKVLEDVQTKSLRIILGRKSRSYATNLSTLELENLEVRRKLKIREFAIKCCKSHQHRWWFCPTPPTPTPPRIAPTRFVLPRTPQARAEKRPLYQYTKILNSLSDNEWEELCLPPPTLIKHQSNTQLYGLVPGLSSTAVEVKDLVGAHLAGDDTEFP